MSDSVNLPFAVIEEDGTVSNIILATSKAIAVFVTDKNCVELPEECKVFPDSDISAFLKIGDRWDGTQFIQQNFE